MSHDELRRWANAPTSKPVMGSQVDTPQEWAWIEFGELKKAEVRALLAERDAAVNALEEAVEIIEDAWNQWAYTNGKGERITGGLSTLEWIEAELPNLRAALAAADAVTGRSKT